MLLQRYARQSDIVVSTPIAGRTQAETEGLIGFLVNTLVLRVDGSGDPTLQELVQRVKEVTLGAYAHQELPFEKLVEELHPTRSLSYQPLFQVMLAMQNMPSPDLEIVKSLSLRPVIIESGSAQFDLTLFVMETPQGISVTAEYDTDLFDRSTIVRMMDHSSVSWQVWLPIRLNVFPKWNCSLPPSAKRCCSRGMIRLEITRSRTVFITCLKHRWSEVHRLGRFQAVNSGSPIES